MSRARLAAIVVAASAFAAGCGSSPPAPPPTTAVTAAPSAPSPPLESSAPTLVVQRHADSGRMFWPGEWEYVLVEHGGRLAVLDVETDVVRGFLDDACTTIPLGASPDLRWLVASTCGRRGAFHVWDLQHDSVRDVDLGSPGVKLWFASRGPWLGTSIEGHATLLDLESGASADVSPPDGLRVDRVEPTASGGALVQASNGDRFGQFVFGPRGGRPFSLDPSNGIWGHAVLGDDLIEYGSNVVRRRRLSDAFRDGPLAEADLCEPTATTDVIPSTDGRFLVVRCQPPLDGAYFLVTTPALDTPKRLEPTVPADSPVIDVGRDTMVVSSDGVHHEVFDLATGERIGAVTADTYSLAKGGKRYRDDKGVLRSTLDDHAIWTARSNVFEGLLTARGDLLFAEDVAFDTRRRERFAATRASRDGRVALRLGEDSSVVVLDRDAGTTWTAATPTAHDFDLSPSGRWVIAAGVDASDANRPQIFLFANSKDKNRTFVSPLMLFAISANDVLASLASLREGPCGARAGVIGSSETCAVVRLDELATGKSRTLDISNVGRLEFTPRGDRLLVNRDAWDPDAKRVVWSVPTGERFDGFAVDANVAVLVSEQGGHARLVDATSGAERARFDGVDRLLAARGTRVLLGGKRRVASVDVDTLAARDFAPVPDLGPAVLSDDGAFVWFVADGFVVARRLADGRELSWLDGDAAPITDELVFDPKDEARVPLRVRETADVLHGRMSPAGAMAATHGHPNLIDDFFAGRDVSPRPAK